VALLALALVASGNSFATAVTWSVTGPGDLTLNATDDVVTFSYNYDVRREYGLAEWVLIGKGFLPGKHVFGWSYIGQHDHAQSETYLRAPDHLLIDPGDENGAFNYSGYGVTIENPVTDNFRFVMRGTNDDLTQFLIGTLELTMAPVPSAIWSAVSGIALLGLIAARRRRSERA